MLSFSENAIASGAFREPGESTTFCNPQATN